MWQKHECLFQTIDCEIIDPNSCICFQLIVFSKTILIFNLYTGEDEEAWTFNEIAANWAVEDLESGIKTCQWAIGKYMSYISYPWSYQDICNGKMILLHSLRWNIVIS